MKIAAIIRMNNKYLIMRNSLTNKSEFPFTYCENEKEGKEILKKNLCQFELLIEFDEIKDDCLSALVLKKVLGIQDREIKGTVFKVKRNM